MSGPDFWDQGQEPFQPLEVICARCGLEGTSDTFIPEEGDEWECPECWERCEAIEREQARILHAYGPNFSLRTYDGKLTPKDPEERS